MHCDHQKERYRIGNEKKKMTYQTWFGVWWSRMNSHEWIGVDTSHRKIRYWRQVIEPSQKKFSDRNEQNKNIASRAIVVRNVTDQSEFQKQQTKENGQSFRHLLSFFLGRISRIPHDKVLKIFFLLRQSTFQPLKPTTE